MLSLSWLKMLPLLDVNMALAKGDFNLLRNLVESGTDVNIQDKEGRTALINCCLHDGEKWALGSARLLLTHGAKVGLCDKVGRNALMYAIMYGREDLVKLFLDALDYDLEHTDKWHHTAQWYAAHCGNTNITTMVKEVSKKYCSDTEVSGKNLNFNSPIQYRTLQQQQQQHKPNTRDYTKNRFNNKRSTANINRTRYLLPFKPLPANLWEKRAKFYCNKENVSSNSIQRSIDYLPALQRTTKPSTIPKKEGIQESSSGYTWREDIKGLTSLLEIQLTSSYQTKARLLPPSIKRYPKIPKDEIKGNLKNEAQEKRGKNRKLSFDGLDVLQNRLSSKGLFRRRCSVAVIPLIRFKNYKSSFSVEQELKKFKSSFA